MNADILLAHYDRIADAPNAVARLRRFVLDLAVRGKLVAREEGGETAGRCNIESINDNTDGPFNLPKTWRWSKLNSLGELIGGGTPSKSNEKFWDGNIPWVSPKDMKVENIYGSTIYITPEAVAKSAVKMIPSDSVLFVVRGMILAHTFPVAINKVPVTINQDMKALVPNRREVANYIMVAMKGLASQMLSKVQRSSHGTCRLEGLSYNQFLLPLPPIAEQHRIVAKVDELMALCDQLEAVRTAREETRDRMAAASLARLNNPNPETFPADARFALNTLPALTTRPDQVKQLRQTVLNLAVQGKLVPPIFTSLTEADELISKVHIDQTRCGLKTSLQPSVGEMYSIPSHWRWTTLGRLITFGPQNGLSPKPTNDLSAPKAITLSATTSGKFDPSCFKRVDANEEQVKNFWLADNDLLFQRGNTREYVGISAIYKGNPREYIFPDLIIRVRISGELNLDFVHLVSIAPFARRFLSDAASGGQTTMPKINQSTLLSLPIPIPPRPEQNAIVAKVNELMALCDALEASLAAASTARARLLEATLQSALAPAEPLLSAAE